MSIDLLKSVREVKACEIHLQTPDQYHLALWNARSCEDCLRLVLAHCGELAAGLIDENTWKPEAIARAIRREFGVTKR